ncbi:hypothetical protein BT96DRAFT_1047208 [Gymnopus androsaceus JB14]|uniref:G protein gamma domain-containing protein n=1 Tax=Gymnopus androsaceus JB14 TaxID=1447944 RepID=A0A6A4HC24_9AGAR|nr:hypothetical protein BT96DRAFT_1047208 [Gymnopus androsaceus JB14]
MATPAHKIVHWNSASPGYSDIESPSCQFSDDSIISTSSLQYVNSQLVAHGFAPAPGIDLEGLSKGDMDRAVKCLLDLLSQRMKDMSRAEKLTTELRTLRYDHERMISMHRTASESAANFEREVNLQKSRLASTTKTLQATEAAHKQTSTELQRTKAALQTVRAAHQAELKKKEKEVERMAEKWNKIADSQAKLGATASGLRFNGALAVELGGQIIGKGKNFLEVALEEAEKAREQLGRDNLGLRKMVLKAVNEVQSIVCEMKHTLRQPNAGTPTPMTLPELFPLSPPDFTTSTLSSALECLRDILKVLSSPTPSTSSSPEPQSAVSASELERLNQVIVQLKGELQRSQEEAASQTAETQAMLDRVAQDHHLVTGRPSTRSENPTNDSSPDITVDLLTVTARDEERERLDTLKKALEEERKKFTEAAIQLGKDRATLEAEKTRLKEEKRSWQVELMLAELPATPDASGAEDATSNLKTSASKLKPSPRKSPSKRFQINVGKGSGSRKPTRRSPSSILASPAKIGGDAEPAFETEFMPPSIIVAPPMMTTSSSTGSLLPTSFVLPPPSPRASLPPPKPALLLSGTTGLLDSSSQLAALQHAPPSIYPPDSVPQTGARPFPVAKPLATRMIHAYSPVRPSPLSPDTEFDSNLSGRGLDALMEMEELEDNMFPPIPQPATLNPSSFGSDDEGGLTLAQQLGLPDSPPESPVFTRPDSPLREKKAQSNVFRKQHPAHESRPIPRKARTAPTPTHTFRISKPRSTSTIEKGKGKARSGPLPIVKTTTRLAEQRANPSGPMAGRKEKENSTSASNSNEEPPDRAGKSVSNVRKPVSIRPGNQRAS